MAAVKQYLIIVQSNPNSYEFYAIISSILDIKNAIIPNQNFCDYFTFYRNQKPINYDTC